MDRREFLKLGLAGTVTLSVAGLGAALTGCARRENAAARGYKFLRDADLALFAALMPAVLADQPVNAELTSRALREIDALLLNSEDHAKAQLFKLLDLLHFAPSRWLTTGVGASWSQASPEQVTRFLDRWRDSSVGLFNAGYRGLVRLVGYGYYALPESQKVAGYPGPLARVHRSANAPDISAPGQA